MSACTHKPSKETIIKIQKPPIIVFLCILDTGICRESFNDFRYKHSNHRIHNYNLYMRPSNLKHLPDRISSKYSSINPRATHSHDTAYTETSAQNENSNLIYKNLTSQLCIQNCTEVPKSEAIKMLNWY